MVQQAKNPTPQNKKLASCIGYIDAEISKQKSDQSLHLKVKVILLNKGDLVDAPTVFIILQ
jgi:hypothetical protein